MDLKLETLMNSICSDDVVFNVTMDVTSYQYQKNGDGKDERVVGTDGKPIIDWQIKNAKVMISYAQCPISKVFDAANKTAKILVQRSRGLTEAEFEEMLKTPFYMKDSLERRSTGAAGAMKNINAMTESGNEEGIEAVIRFAEERLAEMKRNKNKKSKNVES